MEKKNNSFHLARISLVIFYYGEISDIFPGYNQFYPIMG